MSDVTRILEAMQNGDSRAGEELLPLVYAELRALARAKMAREQPGQTLQPTALVHEAWMRLGEQRFKSRAHFLGAAAEAMRRILVENARRKRCQKRGAGAEKVELSELELVVGDEDERILAVSDALEKLAAEDAQAAELVKLRFFAGFSGEETAAALGLPVRTASRLWAYARAWLYRELQR